MPFPVLVKEPELMIGPEKLESNPLVLMVPPSGSSEMVREVTRFPVVCTVPPSKSTNVPKPSGVRAASLATNKGPPWATIMLGPIKELKDAGNAPTAMGGPMTVLVRVLITETVLSEVFIT